MRATDAPAAPAPYVLHLPAADTPWSAVVFASPHSGRHQPPELLAASRLSAHTLRRSEDVAVDALFAAAPAHGAPLVAATHARAWLDFNRAPYDLDPAMFADPLPAFARAGGGRAHTGLGSVPRIVAEGCTIYGGKLAFADAQARIEALHLPYHAALEALLDGARERAGAGLLVDGHSMPSTAARPGVDVVLGDRHGRSCAPAVVAEAEAALRRQGLRVVRNQPFAGGHTTERHGRPAAGRHALQVEFNRALYLDEATLETTAGWPALAGAVEALIAALCALPLSGRA